LIKYLNNNHKKYEKVTIFKKYKELKTQRKPNSNFKKNSNDLSFLMLFCYF